MWTTGRHIVNHEKQVVEVDNDLDRILKPKVLINGSCAKCDLWNVIKISISIGFSYFADLKERK